MKSSCGVIIAAVLAVIFVLIAEGFLIALLVIQKNGDIDGRERPANATTKIPATDEGNSHKQGPMERPANATTKIPTTDEGNSHKQGPTERPANANTKVPATNEGNSYKQGPMDITKRWGTGRLPTNLIPISYNISLRPVMEKDEYEEYRLWGSASLTFECKKPTEYIVLHQSENIVFSENDVTLWMDGNVVEIEDIMFYFPHQFIIVKTSAACKQANIYKLSFKMFSSKLIAGSWFGLYVNEYKKINGTVRKVISSHLQPTGARSVFPCFDEPALKAKFSITLWYKANSTVIPVSNMPAKSSGIGEVIDGHLWNYTIFEETHLVSTYLLAIIVGEYYWESRSSESGVEMRTYASRQSVQNGDVEYATTIGLQLLDFYEKYFGMKYSLPKLDQIAVKRLAFVAMENWGLVMYKDSILLLDDGSSVSDKIRATLTISHEFVHQWFGNLVTPEWWSEIWLNEGFATYFSYVGESDVQPSWKSSSRFLLDEFYTAMDRDQSTTSHPILKNVSTPREIWNHFDVITYNKGACILRMIRGFLGEDAFMSGLRMYLKDNAYGVTTSRKLVEYWDQKETRANFIAPLNDIVLGWLHQPGYPLVTMTRSEGQNSSYRISQEKFSPYFQNRNQTLRSNWHIPFTYKVIGSRQATLKWLSETGTIIQETGLAIANVDLYGYYRLNYDESTWYEIIQRLVKGDLQDISEENRAQLLSDCFAMAKAGRVDVVVPLELSEYLIRETEYLPWSIFLKEVKYFEDMLSWTKGQKHLYKFLLHLIEPMYQKYGWIDEDQMDDKDVVQRLLIKLTVETACRYGHEDCIKKAVRSYSDWMRRGGDDSGISRTYRAVAYCTAIRHGAIREWSFARELHKKTVDERERLRLRFALSCAGNPWILMQYIQKDYAFSLDYVTQHKLASSLAWSYMIEQWKVLAQLGIDVGRLLSDISKRFSTKNEVEMLSDALKSDVVFPNVAEVLAVTRSNVAWMGANDERLNKWLRRRVQELN